jgi:hypothetical protein
MKVRVMVHESDRTPCHDKGQMLIEESQVTEPPTWITGPFPCRHNKPAIILTCELKIPEKENG